MAIERTYYCEGPDCGGEGGADSETTSPCHARTATPPPHLPSGFLEVRGREAGEDYVNHFCGWDCLMKYAAKQPLPTVIPWTGEPDGT